MPCPYFGRSGSAQLKVLIPTNGNQCALILERHAPCYLATDGHPAELQDCKFLGTGREIEMKDWKLHEPPKETTA